MCCLGTKQARALATPLFAPTWGWGCGQLVTCRSLVVAPPLLKDNWKVCGTILVLSRDSRMVKLSRVMGASCGGGAHTQESSPLNSVHAGSRPAAAAGGAFEHGQ